MSNNDEDDEYFLPLVDQRVFGAGIKRKKVNFVPENGEVSTPTASESPASRYLSIVFKNKPIPDPKPESIQEESSLICTKCGHVLHEEESQGETDNQCQHDYFDLAAKTPSHIDRTRLGHRLLTTQGWNPDLRKGLGRNAEGIAIPVKAVPKNDTAGLGLMTDLDEDNKPERKKRKVFEVNEIPLVKQNAKQAREHAERDVKRTAKLRETFYGSIEHEKLLGPNG